SGPQRADRPEDERPDVARERVRLQLRPDDGELTERRIDECSLGAGMPLQHVAEDRRQDEEERKDREEAVVGDDRGEEAALVVRVLLVRRDDEGEQPVPLLKPVEPPDGTEHVHNAATDCALFSVRRGGYGFAAASASTSVSS